MRCPKFNRKCREGSERGRLRNHLQMWCLQTKLKMKPGFGELYIHDPKHAKCFIEFTNLTTMKIIITYCHRVRIFRSYEKKNAASMGGDRVKNNNSRSYLKQQKQVCQHKKSLANTGEYLAEGR